MIWQLVLIFAFSLPHSASAANSKRARKASRHHGGRALVAPALTKVDECKASAKPATEVSARGSSAGATDDKPAAKSEAEPAATHPPAPAPVKVSSDGKMVMIIKQWHLGPRVVTRGMKEKYPQERNQTAIYQALAARIQKKQLQLVLSEGCEGEINKDFKSAFNGWDYKSLHKIAQTKGYDKIITLIPLKLEARFDEQVNTVCGDEEKLIQEGNLRLSNLRGWTGFWTRLREKNSPEKDQLYSEAAADLLKVPKTTPKDQILDMIRDKLKEELAAYRRSLADRNQKFVETLATQDFSTAAVVVGGMHAADLKNKLQAQGFSCQVFEPPGYRPEDEELISEFEKTFDK